MLRLHELLSPIVAAVVPGNHRPLGDNIQMMHVPLDRHRLKGPPPRHGIAIVVKAHGLVFIHDGRGDDMGIERSGWQGQGDRLLPLKALADRLPLPGPLLIQKPQTTGPQMGIQLIIVLDPGNRGGPIPLQIIHPVLHIRLLVAASRQTKERFKTVVTGQGSVPLLEATLSAAEYLLGHGLGIIPPDLPGDTPEKRKSLNHPGQHRLDPLGGGRQSKTESRKAPGDDKYRNPLPTLRKINIDMTKVGFQPSTRSMSQGDKGLPLPAAPAGHIAADLIVAAQVSLFVPQTPVNPGRRMPLFAGSRFILGKNLVNDPLERP
jgi:hypothetical protein